MAVHHCQKNGEKIKARLIHRQRAPSPRYGQKANCNPAWASSPAKETGRSFQNSGNPKKTKWPAKGNRKKKNNPVPAARFRACRVANNPWLLKTNKGSPAEGQKQKI
jgi:hypothetical protein